MHLSYEAVVRDAFGWPIVIATAAAAAEGSDAGKVEPGGRQGVSAAQALFDLMMKEEDAATAILPPRDVTPHSLEKNSLWVS